jgi:hypothetical protein
LAYAITGKINPEVTVLPLTEAAVAMAMLDESAVRGKIVLDCT